LTVFFQKPNANNKSINNNMDKDLFADHTDYWNVAQNIKNIYVSENSLLTLLDFERVLDELDIYAFKNWSLGELVQGPDVGKYSVSCTFMWPEKLMPDPRGARRLLPFDCDVVFKKTQIKIPVKIIDNGDYIPGTKKARIIEKPIWLVEITMPKALISDIRTGSIEFEDEEIDLADLDQAYEDDLDQEQYQDQAGSPAQQAMGAPQAQPAGMGVPNV
jgi:hypothetical protein